MVSRNGNSQYYLRMDPHDKSGSYIHKSEHRKIQCYLQKKYDEEVCALIKLEVANLEKFLKKSSSINRKIQDIYSGKPADIKNIVHPVDISDEDYVKKWLSISYEAKPLDVDVTTYETDNREMVRSKSELNIANTLRKMGVPYRYEKPLKLYNGRVIYPDFTLLDVKRRKEIYWEHRGKMDDLDYASHSVLRLKQLNKSGIIIGDNLIITEESQKNALGTDEIERVVKQFCR